jgi:hypothetical protein
VQLSHTAFDATLLSLAPAHRLHWAEIGTLPSHLLSFVLQYGYPGGHSAASQHYSRRQEQGLDSEARARQLSIL